MLTINIFSIFLIIKIIITKDNNISMLAVRFKTYYPITDNMLRNDSEYEAKDFIGSFLFSKLYLELETGNGTNYQILKTIINSKVDSLMIKINNKNNENFCDFNSSLSSTFKSKWLSLYLCLSEEVFKLYTDTSLTKYKYEYFGFDNYFCLNDSLCGNIGTDICIYKTNFKGKDFITKMHNILNTSELNFAFHYSSDKSDDGIFIFGDMPHNYFKDKYNENDIITFYSKSINFEILMDTITFDGKEYLIEDETFEDKYIEYISVEITPDYEGIMFDSYYMELLKTIYFNKYIEKDICKEGKNDLVTSAIYCYADKFGIEDINKFPKIILTKYKTNFNISFENKDLFFYKDNKYFCKIYHTLGQSKQISLGRIFLKKYLTVFNPDKGQIYFYIKKDENNKISFLEKYKNMILIFFIIGLIIVLIVGILIGKIIFKERKKHANELDDKYEYQSKKNKAEEPLYNSKEDDS